MDAAFWSPRALRPQQQGDDLQGLAQTHVVGQNAAHVQPVERLHPHEAAHLIRAQHLIQRLRAGLAVVLQTADHIFDAVLSLDGDFSAFQQAGLSGAIVEIVSGLYFWMYKETSKQLGKYHKRLEATEKYLIALQIIEMLPEENRSEQYGKLIDYIFENVDKQ